MKYEDVLKRFVANQAQLLQQKQMKQQMKEQMYAEKANALKSFVPGSGQTPEYGMQSPQEEYSETEHNPFEEGQEYRRGGGITNEPTSPEEWAKQIKELEGKIGNPSGWSLDDYNLLQNKLNEYKSWRENTSEGKAVKDYHNVEGEYNIPLPEHLKDYTNAMMKSKFAYANEFGVPSNAIQFDNSADAEYYSKNNNRIVPKLEDGGLIDRTPLSFGAYFEPGMMSPSANLNLGRFNANLSTSLPLDSPRNYSKNYNVDLSYNAGKFGDIGLSRDMYKDNENNPHANTSLRYQVPLSNKLDLMLNANSSDLKDLKNSINGTVGLRYTFEDGGMMTNDSDIECGNCGWTWKKSSAGDDPMTCHNCGSKSGKMQMETGGEMIRRADGSYSQRGMWDNIRDNAGSGKAPTREMLEQERRIRK